MAEWYAEHRVYVAVMAIGGALWARLSAQVYNAPADFERLRRAVRR
jgi:selenocysteine lyase/cysteine desulfurase